MFPCAVCNTPFPTRVALLHHNSTVKRCLTKNRPIFACALDGCSRKYHRHDFLVRHERKMHGMHKAGDKRRPTLNRIQLPPPNAGLVQELPAAREPIITKAVILNVMHPGRDTAKFLQALRPSLSKILTEAIQQHQQIFFDIALDTKLLQDTEGTDETQHLFVTKSFYSKDIALRSPIEIEATINTITELIVAESFDEVQKSELNEILQLEISISKLRAQLGGYIPVHSEIEATKGVLNMKNTDSYCFKWALLASLSSENNALQNLDLTCSYGISDISLEKINYNNTILDFSSLSFPMEVRNVWIFEENNPAISVNVFGVEEKGMKCKIVGPLYRTRKEKQKHVNLLYYENQQRSVCHYAWIRSLPLLLANQLLLKNSGIEICNTCLMYFMSSERYQEHKADPTQCNLQPSA